MKRQVLRWALGIGYVGLVMCLLLIQAGASYDVRGRSIAALEILLLGIPLCVVLVLYIRTTNRMDQPQVNRRHEPADTGVDKEKADADQEAEQDRATDPLSYEETYELFLAAMSPHELSERELEVAWLLYRGYTNRQVGEELFIAETTVKKHVTHIYEKACVTCRKEFREKIMSFIPHQTDFPS